MNRTKLLFNSFIIVIASLVTAYFILVTLSQRSLLDQNFYKQRELDQEIQVKAIASNLSGKVDSTVEKLSLLTEIQEINSGGTAACSEKLTSVFETFRSDFLDTLSRMGADGVFNCSIAESTIGYDGKTLPHLVEILEDPEHEPVMGPPTASHTDGRLFTSIHVPIFGNDGDFKGTLGTALFFDELASEFIASQVSDEDQVQAFIVNDTGEIIASTNTGELGSEFESEIDFLNTQLGHLKSGALDQSILSETIENRAYTVGKVVPIEGHSWMIVLISSAQQVDADALGFTSGFVGNVWIMIGSLVAVVVTAVVIVLYYANRNIFSPFIAIKHSVDKIGEGKLNARIDVDEVGSYSEFRKLSESINDMADKLKINYEKLDIKASSEEKKATKATVDLEKKVEELERINQLMIGREEKMIEMKKKIAELESKK